MKGLFKEMGRLKRSTMKTLTFF
jgi:hypothetical protein